MHGDFVEWRMTVRAISMLTGMSPKIRMVGTRPGGNSSCFSPMKLLEGCRYIGAVKNSIQEVDGRPDIELLTLFAKFLMISKTGERGRNTSSLSFSSLLSPSTS